MASSFAERLRKKSQESKKSSVEFEKETAGAKARICPGCGAGRALDHGVKECRYCGYVFITADI
ncbi:MAG: hypothetical protein Q4D85_02880 [Corynebacterium sp.]|uniref:hypothetical protein n=1 Tax=Corynebacterium sp. TaxID=1720 RepID=UPI0026DB0D53|nr:hypothetical protein [Corynebacterium sp.]MDO5097675.1 hypothetical protein [Corynebacterium sp.]